MTQPWICASCRRLLRHRTQPPKQSSACSLLQNAAYSNGFKSQPGRGRLFFRSPDDEPITEKPPDQVVNRPIPSTYSRYDRSVEDDFVMRLMQENGHDLSSGPYSNPRSRLSTQSKQHNPVDRSTPARFLGLGATADNATNVAPSPLRKTYRKHHDIVDGGRGGTLNSLHQETGKPLQGSVSWPWLSPLSAMTSNDQPVQIRIPTSRSTVNVKDVLKPDLSGNAARPTSNEQLFAGEGRVNVDATELTPPERLNSEEISVSKYNEGGTSSGEKDAFISADSIRQIFEVADKPREMKNHKAIRDVYESQVMQDLPFTHAAPRIDSAPITPPKAEDASNPLSSGEARSPVRSISQSPVSTGSLRSTRSGRQRTNSKSKKHTAQTSGSWANPASLTSSVTVLETRLGRATEHQSQARVDRLWVESYRLFPGDGQPYKSDHIHAINLFLSAYMSIRQPNKAIEVWNWAMARGVAPNVSMWDAMLRGCGLARDPVSLRDVWKKIHHAGTHPDSRLWTTRIHGLMLCGQYKQAIAAFVDMMRQWVQAAQKKNVNMDLKSAGDLDGTPKPTVHALNTIVTGLAKRDKEEELAKVLQLGRALGIKPDTFTFNPLLEWALASNNTARAEKIWQQMRANHVEPDIASFAIRLEALFRGFDIPQLGEKSLAESAIGEEGQEAADEGSAVRTAAISNLFKEMNEAKIQANTHTFGIILKGLLLSRPPSVGAASALLQYMKKTGVALSSAIYTMLIRHYFATQEPDLGAVEALWNRARMERYLEPDVMFYEKLIVGYSKLGHIGKALTALNQASSKGRVPGWTAMAQLLRALGQAGDYERAQEIVDGVMKQDRDGHAARSAAGKNGFWNTARELRLVVGEEA